VEIVSDDYRYVAFQNLAVRSDQEGDAPHFEGWACRHDTLDAYGTEFAPGSWSAGGLDGEAQSFLTPPQCFLHQRTADEATGPGDENFFHWTAK